MLEMRFEPFIGLRLLVFENKLRDRGTIIDCFYGRDGIMTFVTETGEYSFFYLTMVHLSSGDWKLPGSAPRWAYVCQTDSLYARYWKRR